MRPLDAVVAVWVAAWIGLGVAVGSELRDLTALSGTVTRVGTAAQEVGSGLGDLGALPVVGDRVQRPAQAISDAGRSAVSSGRSSAESVRTASTLLGLAIALIPSTLVLFIYVPARVRWARERRWLQRALREARGDPRFEVWLARRALDRQPYDQLGLRIDDPWTGANREEASVLAAAELARFGLAAPQAER